MARCAGERRAHRQGREGPVRSWPVSTMASQIQGRGLFAIAPISAGEIVAIKGGHIVDTATLHALAAGACWPASAGGTGPAPPARAARRDPPIGVHGLVAHVLRRRVLRHEFPRVSRFTLLAADHPGPPDS